MSGFAFADLTASHLPTLKVTHLNFKVVQSHQQLCPEGAVVDVAGPQEEGTQELKHHVIEADRAAHHVRQLLNHLALPA